MTTILLESTFPYGLSITITCIIVFILYYYYLKRKGLAEHDAFYKTVNDFAIFIIVCSLFYLLIYYLYFLATMF
jgi:hypothetical protein